MRASMRLMARVLPVLLLALLAAACSPQQGDGAAARFLRTGNEAFAKQAFEEALQEYRAAQAEAPERAEPYYNAANALYRQGKYAEALREIQKAVALAAGTDSELAPDGFYNAGNSAFQTENWLGAAESYKQALLRNPADQDAKHNLELALQKLVENQQSQNQDQDDQQDEEQNQDQQENQDQEEQQQTEQSQDQEQQQDEKPSEDGQDQQKEQQPEPSEDGQEKAKPEQSENGQEQPDPEGQPQQEPQPDEQGEQREGQGQPQPDNQPQQPRPGQTPPQGPGQRMTPEQARQLLAAIARQSDTLQDRLGEVLAVRGRPPVQDW